MFKKMRKKDKKMEMGVIGTTAVAQRCGVQWNEAGGGWRWMMVGMWGLREEMRERGLYSVKGKNEGGRGESDLERVT